MELTNMKKQQPVVYSFEHPVYQEPKLQSPINIRSAFVDRRYDCPILWSSAYFQTPLSIALTDNNQTLQLSVNQEEPLYVTSKLLNYKPYYLKHINFHWGYKNAKGSEHQIDGRSYTIEMQAVHYQCTTQYLQNYLIISYLIELKNMYNWGLKKILLAAPLTVKKPNVNIPVDPFPLKELLYTASFPYFMYGGSLTAPPYDENVRWIVSAMPLPINKNQLNVFKMLCKKNKNLRNNFREIQNSDLRLVTYVKDSFKHRRSFIVERE